MDTYEDDDKMSGKESVGYNARSMGGRKQNPMEEDWMELPPLVEADSSYGDDNKWKKTRKEVEMEEREMLENKIKRMRMEGEEDIRKKLKAYDERNGMMQENKKAMMDSLESSFDVGVKTKAGNAYNKGVDAKKVPQKKSSSSSSSVDSRICANCGKAAVGKDPIMNVPLCGVKKCQRACYDKTWREY